MDVEFSTGRLQRCFESETEAIREWGPQVGPRYIPRVLLLQAAHNFADLFSIQTLSLRPLRGGRAGEWATTIRGRWRMNIERSADETLVVKEMSSHYGD
jgi:plasmid maintenance system killer protein